MASTSSAAGPLPPEVKAEIKPDPDIKSKALTGNSKAPIRIKHEQEPASPKIDESIPIASDSEEDMFDQEYNDDEDGPVIDEVVDMAYEGLVHINGVEHFVCKSFKIRQIQQPVVQMIDLQSIFGCLEYGSMVVNEDYQREMVWDEHRASTLINSILMGYFVPPIIFNRKQEVAHTTSGGTKLIHRKHCVDGKQRLTALRKFMNGDIGIWDSNTPQKKWYFCHPKVRGKEYFSSHNIMPKAVREFFTQRRLCCYEYNELTEDIEQNMFQLVQRGLTLSSAERMRAMNTAWALFARQYEEDYEIVVNLSKQSRASGFRSVLTIFAMIQEVLSDRKGKPPSPALQASPQALGRLLEDKQPINPTLKLKIKAVFDKLEELVKLSSTQTTATRYEINKNSVFDPAPDFLREDAVNHVKTFSPLELISSTVLVAIYLDIRTDDQLLNDIKELRQFLRLTHKDLRVNTACWATAWIFISKVGTVSAPGESATEIATRSKAARAATMRASLRGVPKAARKPKKSKDPKKPKKPKKTKPVPKKAPNKKPRRKIADRAAAEAESSGLSSAPSSEDESSDDESDDELMNGTLSPIFPAFMPVKTKPVSQAVTTAVDEPDRNERSSASVPPNGLTFVLEEPQVKKVVVPGNSIKNMVLKNATRPKPVPISENDGIYSESVGPQLAPTAPRSGSTPLRDNQPEPGNNPVANNAPQILGHSPDASNSSSAFTNGTGSNDATANDLGETLTNAQADSNEVSDPISPESAKMNAGVHQSLETIGERNINNTNNNKSYVDHEPTDILPAPNQKHCKYFSAGGECYKEDKCRFIHDQETRNQALKDMDANATIATNDNTMRHRLMEVAKGPEFNLSDDESQRSAVNTQAIKTPDILPHIRVPNGELSHGTLDSADLFMAGGIGALNEASDPPVKIKIEPGSPNLLPSNTDSAMNKIPPVAIKIEDDTPALSPSASGTNGGNPPKPPSRFKPRVPRLEERASSKALAEPPVVIGNQRPLNKRPYNWDADPGPHPPKKPKADTS